MRGVRTWRSIRVRSYVLPLLLGALALRFLIPTGFMPGEVEGTSLTVALCSAEKGQTENFEIPGEPAKPHCDRCMSPSLGSPLTPFSIAGLPHTSQTFLPSFESQISEAPLARAQIPRAPPRA